MKVSVGEAAALAGAMGAVIFFCRAFPFLFFSGPGLSRSKGVKTILDFVERVVPPAAMTVLAFNALGPSFMDLAKTFFHSGSHLSGEAGSAQAALVAAFLTVITYLWKRNPLLSIFGGTAAFMVLQRIIA